jgi:hypothetical protein
MIKSYFNWRLKIAAIMKAIIEKIRYFLPRHEKPALLLLFLLALILKILHAVIIYQIFGTTKWADDWEYLSMGRQIAAGDWFPKIIGHPYMQFYLYNIVLTSLLVVVLFYLGKNIFDRNVGWLLALWGVFNRDFFTYNPHLLKEATVFLFLPLTLLFLVTTIRTNAKVRSIFFAALSFSWLIHSDERYFLYFPFFALAFLLLKPVKIKRIIQLECLWVGLVFLLMIPWGVRNYKIFDKVVIITPRTTAFTAKIWGEDISRLFFNKGNKIDKESYKLALEFGKEQGITPREYGKYEAYARAFINFWQPTYFKATYIQYGFRPQKWSLAHNIVGIVFYGIFLPFYLLGIVILIIKKHLLGIYMALIPIIHSFFHTFMIWPLERYRSPVNFIVVLIGIWTILRLFKERKNVFSAPIMP